MIRDGTRACAGDRSDEAGPRGRGDLRGISSCEVRIMCSPSPCGRGEENRSLLNPVEAAGRPQSPQTPWSPCEKPSHTTSLCGYESDN